MHRAKDYDVTEVPDDEESSTDPTLENVIAFINSKSGKQKSHIVMKGLSKYLGKSHVFDLSQGGPLPGLEQHRHRQNLRVIACGGDGTVSWVMNAIDDVKFDNVVSVAILPIGTGNDLGRVLGWGYKYRGEPLEKVLRKVASGQEIKFDRWSLITIPVQSENRTNNIDAKNELPLKVFNNYFSFGTDAKIALDFHLLREKNPEAFTSITYNKFQYAKCFLKDFLINRSCKNMAQHIKVFECDGVSYLDKIREKDFNSIVFVNIKSYSSGTNPWKDKEGYSPQGYSDGKIECVGFRSIDLMWLQLGIKGNTIAQPSKIRIVTDAPLPMQVDGEPCMLGPSEIIIDLKNKASMIIPCTA